VAQSVDNIIRKGRKLYALANRGDSGEKANAKAFLEEYMKKYNLKEEDVSDENLIRRFKKSGLEYCTIATNSIMSVNPFCKIKDDKKFYELKLDDSDFNEVEYKTNFFYELFLKEFDRLFDTFKSMNSYGNDKNYEKELFFTSFMTKHTPKFQPEREALLKHKPKDKPLSQKEIEALKKAQKEAEKAFKAQKKDDAPKPIEPIDTDRMVEIMRLMKDSNYVRARNTLPVYNNYKPKKSIREKVTKLLNKKSK